MPIPTPDEMVSRGLALSPSYSRPAVVTVDGVEHPVRVYSHLPSELHQVAPGVTVRAPGKRRWHVEAAALPKMPLCGTDRIAVDGRASAVIQDVSDTGEGRWEIST